MITSTSNTTIKEIKSLRLRKNREDLGASYVEGLRLVMQAFQEGVEIRTLIWSPELLTSDFGRAMIGEQSQKGIPTLEVSGDVFKSLSEKDGPQGIAAVVAQEYVPLESLVTKEKAVLIALDAVQDPGNLGTILRTADATGVGGIILLENSTDAYDPAAVQASMGAIFTQKVARTTLGTLKNWKDQHHLRFVGTSDKASDDYHEFHYQPPLVVFMGSERQGLKPEQIKMCDNLVRIPMVGKCDSLNLAIATGVMLYEIINQSRVRK